MISLPELKEKQILFIRAEWGERCGIKFLNDNIVFTKNGKIANRASCHKVLAVFVSGDITITTGLMKNALRYGISFFFMKNNFEVYTSFLASADGNYLLRAKQYNFSKEREIEASKNIIKDKIYNQIELLIGAGKGSDNLMMYRDYIFKQIEKTEDNKTLLGIEGNMAKSFFPVYFKEMGWRRRAPRAKQDVVNFLMDMGYTFLFNFADSLLRLHGFDNYKGFYHKLFFQRRSLACDMIEPFRCLVDKQIMKSFNLGQINEKDFNIIDGKYTLPFENNQKYVEIFMKVIMDKKSEIFKFINTFYYFMMNDKNDFPSFRLKEKAKLI